jgi:hypothetical protein
LPATSTRSDVGLVSLTIDESTIEKYFGANFVVAHFCDNSWPTRVIGLTAILNLRRWAR